MSTFYEDDALGDALTSRHIPHSRSRRKGSGGGGGGGGKQQKAFDPLATIGTYEILCKAAGVDTDAASWLTIHGMTEDESGLIASFAIGTAVEAMGVLAGSRKGLKELVDELEVEQDDQENEDEDEDDEDDDDDGPEEVEHVTSTNGDEDEEEEEEEEEDEGEEEKKDRMINRRADRFEKNSFRNPKFWLCWRGKVRVGTGEEVAYTGEKNMGYLIWKSNRCEKFEGTLSCDTLGWDNVKIKGHRIRKGAPECHLNWTDVEVGVKTCRKNKVRYR